MSEKGTKGLETWSEGVGIGDLRPKSRKLCKMPYMLGKDAVQSVRTSVRDSVRTSVLSKCLSGQKTATWGRGKGVRYSSEFRRA